jgi:predicted DNA-binding transcriptional regulator AlpA
MAPQQAKRRPPLNDGVSTANDHRVLTFREWCTLIGVSHPTGKRILKSGNGPKVIQLHTRRIGIRMSDNARWLEQRVRT